MQVREATMNRQPPAFSPWLGWMLLSLFGIFQFALQGSIGILSPGIKESFQVDATAISILSSSFFYSYILMQVPVGMFYDTYRMRHVVTAALVLVGGGCIFFALSPTLGFAICARILIGLGCSFGFIGVLFCTQQWFAPARFAFLSGLAECLSMGGTGLANMLLSEGVKRFEWRVSLGLCALWAFVLAALVWIVLARAHEGQAAQVVAGKPAGLANRERLLRSLKVVGSSKEMWLSGLFAAFTFSVMSAFVGLWGVPFLMQMYSLDVVGASTAMAMIYLGIGVSSPLLGWAVSRISMRLLMAAGSVLCGIILLLVIYGSGWSLMQLYALLFGLGFTTSVYQLAFILVCQSVPDYCQGVAIGTTNMITMISAPILQPAIGVLLSLSQGGVFDGYEAYTLAEYQKALVVLPICYGLGFIVSLFLKGKPL